MEDVVRFSDIAKLEPLTVSSHLNEVGSVYVPRILGGVAVHVDPCKDGRLKVTLCPNGTAWKRYVYIGIKRTREIFRLLNCGTSTLALQFEQDKASDCWVTYLGNQ